MLFLDRLKAFQLHFSQLFGFQNVNLRFCTLNQHLRQQNHTLHYTRLSCNQNGKSTVRIGCVCFTINTSKIAIKTKTYPITTHRCSLLFLFNFTATYSILLSVKSVINDFRYHSNEQYTQTPWLSDTSAPENNDSVFDIAR